MLAAPVPRLGAGQHGVFGLGQLHELGLTASAVQKRAAAGRLFRVHRGVYALEQHGMFIDIGTPEDYALAQVLCDRLYEIAFQDKSTQGRRVDEADS